MTDSQRGILLQTLGIVWPHYRMPVKNFFFATIGDRFYADCVALREAGLLKVNWCCDAERQTFEFTATAEGVQAVVGLRMPREVVEEWLATEEWPKRRKRTVTQWPSCLKRAEG